MQAADRSGSGAGGQPLAQLDPLPVRLRFEARATGNAWQPQDWRLCGLEPGEFGDPVVLVVHRDEAEGYYLNLTTDEPSVFVLWRLEDGAPVALAATLSYNEAARWMDGGETVDRMPMPSAMLPWLAEFTNLHYRPEGRRKRGAGKPSFMTGDEFSRMVERETDPAKPPALDGD